MSKSILLSRTFWFNAFTVIVAGLTWATDVIPAAYQPALLAVVGVVNVILRSITTQPVTIPGSKS